MKKRLKIFFRGLETQWLTFNIGPNKAAPLLLNSEREISSGNILNLHKSSGKVSRWSVSVE